MRLLLPLLIATAACSPTTSESGQGPQGEQSAPSAPAEPAPPATPEPAAPPTAAECDASKAQFAVGQTYNAELAEQARTAAGAKTVRRLVPGQVVTMEYNGSRLNLDTDAAGKVTSARCG